MEMYSQNKGSKIMEMKKSCFEHIRIFEFLNDFENSNPTSNFRLNFEIF